MSTPDPASNGSNSNANGVTSNDQATNQNSNQQQDEVKDPAAILAKNRELLAENARIKAERKALQDERDAAERARVEASGDKDAIIESLRKQSKEAEDRRIAESKRYAKTTVNEQLMAVAREMGADKPEMVLRLVDTADISIDDDFRVDKDAVKTRLGKLKEEMPALFKAQSAAPRDGTPGGFSHNGKSDLSKLSREDLKKEYRKLGSKK